MKQSLAFLSGILSVIILSAQSVPTEFKQCVVFIYLQSSIGEPIPDGTGFYMITKSPKDTASSIPVLITAKHVIQNKDGSLLKSMLLRMNTHDSVRYIFMRLNTSGENRNVFFHEDSTVDLVVILGAPGKSDYEFKYLPDNFLASREEYKIIPEGTEAFFTGLFTSYIGEKRNYPIFRFGHVALVSNEKILFTGMKREIAIVETSTYGGNSGSPIFYKVYENQNRWTYKLGGLVNGFFGNYTPLELINTGANIPVTDLNIGIAAVTPSYFIRDILNSEIFKRAIQRK